jgi:hypothetical protein
VRGWAGLPSSSGVQPFSLAPARSPRTQRRVLCRGMQLGGTRVRV